MINAPASGAPALPIYDRELSLSGNAVNRDAGMLAYINANTGTIPSSPALSSAVARMDTYTALVAGQTLTVSDPAKGVIANDTNVYGVQLLAAATSGTVTLNANGTFTYVPTGSATSDSFTYCANGSVTAGVCSSGITATVNLGASNIVDTAGVTCTSTTFNASIATYLAIKTPGVLASCIDGANLPLTVATSSIASVSPGLTVLPDANGGFTASATAAGSYTFMFQAQNSQGKLSAPTTVTLNFPTGSGLAVTVLDGYDKKTTISDYRWIIEEDRSFYIDPKCSTNPPPAGCPTVNLGIVPLLGTNFHTSYMPYVAQGCTGTKSCEGGQMIVNPATGTHSAAVCDVGNGVCRPDTTGNGFTQVLPSQVALDPTKRYYISILPGDAANPFYSAGPVGHGMGGAPIAAGQTTVTVFTQPSPYPPGKLSVMVFEDDFPLNGEQDGGGGVGVLAPQEPGLGGFQIHLWDAFGGNGDFTGQMTYDMFNQPLSNSLDGTIDPVTGLNACPITKIGNGITGMIVTCPKYESDGATLSPLAGQAVIANLMPGRWGTIATPGADRIARGEEWLQTNTLDGQKAHDVFTRIGEPSYFQEFGPSSFHVTIGFANPAIINARKQFVCNGSDPTIGGNCNPGNTLTGKVTGERLSRTPDERLYSSTSHDAYAWSQCFVSFGDPDGEDFAFTKCAADGTFTLTGLPDGDWRVTVFDQWNDILVDGLSTPVRLGSATNFCPGAGSSQHNCNLGDIASTQWQANLYTRTFVDDNKDGISQADEAGIPFSNVAVRLRDGSLENLLITDFSGIANFNETFPLFSWYTVETDTTRYKTTGMHVVYDVGGPADGTLDSCGGTLPGTGYPPCGTSTIGKYLANTVEQVSVPTNLRVPGAVYCATADCTGKTIQAPVSDPPSVCTTATAAPFATTCSTKLSSGRIDPPMFGVEGWQGFPGQSNFIEFGKEPYIAGENGGIKGHVIYASTRPFDDPQMLVQTQWEPLVPNVTINLYQEGVAADGVTPTLRLVDTTQTSSFDNWAQGFHLAADGVTRIPNMSCPGQGASSGTNPDLFFFSLFNQPQYLDFYNNVLHGTAGSPTALPNNSQFKCYDGMHNWNQIQPAPYDGMYRFPSVTSFNPTTGKPTGTNCTICSPDPVPSPDLYAGIPMLPAGKYVVEVVVPPGFELVKEEDKNILIGDNFIAPVTQQFGGLGAVFIMPDQASVAAANSPGLGYNANNAQNPTQSFGASPSNGIVPGFVPEPIWPCVGEARIVPDYISLYPQSQQVAPFAGATRNLCDRKEVTLADQMGAIAKFFIYTSTHIASKFTGGITDDYTSEFDPFSPQFGEKFAPPNLPVSLKDWTGTEISRVYADQWGSYDGMTYSSWEVNPPNPTGYSPTMMVFCMNDPGPIPAGPGGTLITDPAFTPGYSQFCYELPFMPGTTQYLDTPVVPTSAFAGAGYNNVDCAYPAATPAVSEVDGDGVGPWIAAAGTSHPITITAFGDQTVPNYAYSGPAATTAPFNQKTITRHYGFGGATGTVTIGGQAATVTSWMDTSITVTVPASNTVPLCAVQQQAQYEPAGTTAAQCGQLVITAANGQQSIDTVTVTIGGKAPTHVPASATIQSAIDAAQPGDLLIIDPTCITAGSPVACGTAGATTNTTAAHNELLLMWKPVRLQGVGAASSLINANTHPAGKLDPWRRQVACLFGIALNGTPISATNPFDSPTDTANNGGPYTCSTAMNFSVDRLPTEPALGWDATLNGNLAQLLQEPSIMGALEGAGITVLGKGVNFHGVYPWNDAAEAGGFPAGTTLLTGNPSGTGGVFPLGDANPLCHTSASVTKNPFPSNFQCNPSSIDGLTITDSSQGGGGIFVHGWNHNLQIANNRIYGNAGTLSGGISVGQGEFPPSYIAGSATNFAPGSCQPNLGPAGIVQPYCHNLNVNIHNNAVTLNSSIGDELFSGTPAGGGGVTVCTGADYYKFNYNWVCGNLSSGDGGGFAHIGFSVNADIEHNTLLFNQSLNPTIPANGGGMVIMGAPDADPTCGSTTDSDCVPTPGSIGPSDGVGRDMLINANLIMGNGAEAGSGGGIAFQNVNGSDVVAFPIAPANWNDVTVTNNIIADNVAGWDGAGISLLDALKTNIINNTIISNASTASAGILFTTIGNPLASSPGKNCTTSATTSCPQVGGLVSIQNSSVLMANLPATITCPANHYAGTTASNGSCRTVSYPLLDNNIFWQNTSYYIGVGALSPHYQQNVVSLYNAFTTTPTLVPSQPQAGATAPNGNGVIITGGTGACILPGTAGAPGYWDIGVRGDTGPGNHASGVTLTPNYSVLTNPPPVATSENGLGTHNLLGINPTVLSQYCDGSRQPPEFGSAGWAVPPGIADATVPNPVFNLTPVATVDEGNNWINLRWGPLSLVNPMTGATLGNYSQAAGSPVIDYIPSGTAAYAQAPGLDFFGNARKTDGNVDVGAVEFQATTTAPLLIVTPTALSFSGTVVGTTSVPAQVLTLRNDGPVGATATLTGITVSAPFARAAAPGTCGATLGGGGATCTIRIVFRPTAAGSASGTVTIMASVPVNGSPVELSGTGIATITTATVTGGPLAFGNQALGTTSAVQTVVVTNTGNIALAGGAFTFGGGTPQPFARVNTGPFPAGAPNCGAALALGASCTIKVAFTPTTATAFSRTLTVAYTGTTVTGSPVTLTGTGLGAAITFALPTLTTTPANTSTKTGVVTVTNAATATESFTFTAAPTITKVGTAGGGFSIIAGGTCSATTVLAPGSPGCTVNVQYAPGTSTATATAHVTITGTGLATATLNSPNFTAN
jgi:hypothetical protein